MQRAFLTTAFPFVHARRLGGRLAALGCIAAVPWLTAGCSESTGGGAATPAERTRYVGQSAHKLAQIDVAIDTLRARVARRDTVRSDVLQQVDELDLKRQEAQHRIEELRQAGPESWPEARREVSDALVDLQDEVKQVQRRARR